MVKERSLVSTAKKRPWKLFLGMIALFCLLAISACGSGTETARVYDSARVLNTARVQAAARNVPANVDVYTVNRFAGTQGDFQRAVTSKLADDVNRIVMGIDTQHSYQYIARGSNIPLNSSSIAQASNAFAANYGNGDYTRATVAALDSMGNSLRANGVNAGNRPNANPLPWLLPLLIIGGLLLFLTKLRRPQAATLGTNRPTYQPSQPERPMRDYTDQGARPLQTTERPTYPQTPERPVYPSDQGTITPPTHEKEINPLGPAGGTAAGGLGYELGKRQGEIKPPTPGPGNMDYGSGGTEYGGKGYTGKKKPNAGGGGTYGKGGTDYGTTDTGGGGRFSKGADYGTTDTGGGGTFGSGGSDYDRER